MQLVSLALTALFSKTNVITIKLISFTHINLRTHTHIQTSSINILPRVYVLRKYVNVAKWYNVMMMKQLKEILESDYSWG